MVLGDIICAVEPFGGRSMDDEFVVAVEAWK